MRKAGFHEGLLDLRVSGDGGLVARDREGRPLRNDRGAAAALRDA